MLTITRRAGQSFKLGDDITVHIVRLDRSQVRVSIEAPKDIKILRSELALGLPIIVADYLDE